MGNGLKQMQQISNEEYQAFLEMKKENISLKSENQDLKVVVNKKASSTFTREKGIMQALDYVIAKFSEKIPFSRIDFFKAQNVFYSMGKGKALFPENGQNLTNGFLATSLHMGIIKSTAKNKDLFYVVPNHEIVTHRKDISVMKDKPLMTAFNTKLENYHNGTSKA